jgi:hypothetical protein
LFLNQTVSYSPSYLFGLFPQSDLATPGAIRPLSPDYVIDDSESIAFGTVMAVSHRLTRRSSVSVTGDVGGTRFTRRSGDYRNLRTYGVAAQYSRALARNTSLQAGYRYRDGDFGHGPATIVADTSSEHIVDVGVTYTRPLSSTRQFTLGAGFGSSTVRAPLPTDESGPSRGGDHRSMTGQATVSYQPGRLWLVRTNYLRGVEYVAGLTEPVLVNGWMASLTGLIAPKLDASSSFGYSSGGSALSANSLRFDTYTADARLRYALNNSVFAFAEYIRYYYDFDDAIEQAANLPAGLKRNGVRVGVTLRHSLLSR